VEFPHFVEEKGKRVVTLLRVELQGRKIEEGKIQQPKFFISILRGNEKQGIFTLSKEEAAYFALVLKSFCKKIAYSEPAAQEKAYKQYQEIQEKKKQEATETKMIEPEITTQVI
jgi:hypothetical protein